jgi:heme-degrading monooxygenase HmoA
VEVTVLTFWDSEEAVARFAGDAPERAVVEPEARAQLTSFDERVTHHQVMLDTSRR